MEYKHLSKRGVLGEGEGWKEDEEKRTAMMRIVWTRGHPVTFFPMQLCLMPPDAMAL